MQKTLLLAFLVSGGLAHAAEPTLVELLNAADDVTRGESSRAKIEMQVKTRRYERTMQMEAFSMGTDKSLVRILAPAKDAGISTLMVDDNIWNYLPKVDRTMKVPGAMMSGSWMGSHFSNDDLVKANRLADEFDGEITQRPGDNDQNAYEVTLVPKPDAPVVWGKVVLRVTPELLPVDITYYDEDGSLKRTMRFEEVKDFGGEKIPSVMTLIPADKPEEFTRIVYLELDFDVKFDAQAFSLQALKR